MADIFDKMFMGINKGVETLSEGSKNIVEKAKINTAVNNAKEEKRKNAENLGLKAYEMISKGQEIPEELKEFCYEMKKNDDKIEELSAELEALNSPSVKETQQFNDVENDAGFEKACVICPECGHAGNPGARFCVKCGKQIG